MIEFWTWQYTIRVTTDQGKSIKKVEQIDNKLYLILKKPKVEAQTTEKVS